MRMALVLAACLLAPCTGLHVPNFLARQKGGLSSAASLRVGKESTAYAMALGYLLDMAGVPMALRVPAARAVINREADLMEQLHGYTHGAEVFRSHMPRLVPDEMMYYCKGDPTAEASEDAKGEDEGDEGANASEHGRVITLSRVRTQGTEIMRDGDGGFVVRATTCVDGECTRSSKAVDGTGAGHITPKVPVATIARMMAGMSNIARQLEEELEELEELEGAVSGLRDSVSDLRSELPGIIGGSAGDDDEAAPSEEENTTAGLDMFRAAMEKIIEHGPLVPEVLSLDRLKEMRAVRGFGPEPPASPEMMDRSSAARPDPVDPFEDLKTFMKEMMPGFGEGFPFGEEPSEGHSAEPSEAPSYKEGPPEDSAPITLRDLIHRIFKEEPSEDEERSEDEKPAEDEEPPEGHSEANPLTDLNDLIHRILEDMSGDAPPGDLGEAPEHPRRAFTVTRLGHGHGVQEVTTCMVDGKCTTERHEFAFPTSDAPEEREEDGDDSDE